MVGLGLHGLDLSHCSGDLCDSRRVEVAAV